MDPASQPEEASGDENMFPSPIRDLAPELVSLAKMIEEGIPAPEINARLLQAFGSMTVKSQSLSLVKQRSHGLSPVPDLGKRYGQPSTEGLPLASLMKKSRLQPVKNSVEGSPQLPTTSLTQSLYSQNILMEPASLMDPPSLLDPFESTPNTPEASSFTITRSRGDERPTQLHGGGGQQGWGNTKKPALSAWVTRSTAPKKRSTRANPN